MTVHGLLSKLPQTPLKGLEALCPNKHKLSFDPDQHRVHGIFTNGGEIGWSLGQCTHKGCGGPLSIPLSCQTRRVILQILKVAGIRAIGMSNVVQFPAKADTNDRVEGEAQEAAS